MPTAASPTAPPFRRPAPCGLKIEANAEIYAQGDPVRRLYRLHAGVVRTARVAADGRRQVGGFYYPGEVFGLEVGDEHLFSAEALTPALVESLGPLAPASGGAAAAPDPILADVTRQELRRAHAHLMLLGRKSAREKVALFLMEHAARDQGGGSDLPMGRQDIADYLGLTIETVSRMLTQLQGEAVITLPTVRRFEIKRWDVMRELAA